MGDHLASLAVRNPARRGADWTAARSARADWTLTRSFNSRMALSQWASRARRTHAAFLLIQKSTLSWWESDGIGHDSDNRIAVIGDVEPLA